ncbi:MAG: LysR family transcriptional regulator, partial [Oscillospiraceae bacterium]|nr:LysR family transcriptional regulator [Oscillospiraceae bacterium]
ERELQTSLVLRGAKSLSLTDAGREFLIYAEKIVSEYESMTERLTKYKHDAESRVSVYTEPLCEYGYADMLTRFKHHSPEIETEVAQLRDGDFAALLSVRDDIVCIMFSNNQSAPAGTRVQTLVGDRLAVLVGKSHRFAGMQNIKLQQLQGEPLQIISHEQSHFLNTFVAAQCHIAGFMPEIVPYDLSYSAIRETARELGIAALIPERIAKTICGHDMQAIEVADSGQFFINAVISDKCANEAAKALFSFLESDGKA